MTIELTIQDASNGCAALAGAAVYLWHCNRDGHYSLYSEEIADQNYLRGVQEAASDGVVTFTSIFPACYSGRWPHIHFEVYPSLAAATDDANRIATSQIALPEETCNAVYATDGYSESLGNLQQTSLQTDNVFGDDGGAHGPARQRHGQRRCGLRRDARDPGFGRLTSPATAGAARARAPGPPSPSSRRGRSGRPRPG